MSELEKLISIPKLYSVEQDLEPVKIIPEKIRAGICVNREMPDIGGEGFSIEHTEVFPFFRSSKGDSFKRYQSAIQASKRVIEFEKIDVYYQDFPTFLKKLGILARSQFKENIIQAIKEKSEKFKKYERYEINGLWLEFPEYISFPNSDSTAYLLQDDIYDVLLDCPFDFFAYGNAQGLLFISKDFLSKMKSGYPICQHFFLEINNGKDFMVFEAKAKEKIVETPHVEFRVDALKDMHFVTEDMCIRHMYHFQVNFKNAKETQLVASLYCDDLVADVTSFEEGDGTYKVFFKCEGIDGKLETNFQDLLNFSFSNIPFEAGEKISLHVSQHNDKNKQKIFTGIKRLVLDRGNSIDIYITPHHQVLKPENFGMFRIGDLVHDDR
ncbi:hypothetical protein F9817_12810 [Vibrio sp. CAIM 722]|uniref:Uncharacterized protein n=1 Tax=Vibrio eleionomae TaxID=2653505 RepID=A0A7X4RV11_9VIBR|nr:hypothetical protein [Vibrio eleionomae]MZI94073.1 hypothetical protein [Vibrio eleionomae]